MAYKFFIPLAALTLISCKDGDDAAFFNNTNEMVVNVDIPLSYEFDRLTIPVIVEYFDNNSFKGKAAGTQSVNMFKENEANEKVISETSGITSYNLLDSGAYYAHCFIDLNKNGEKNKEEPFMVFNNNDGTPKEVKVMKESRRTLDFDFSEILK
jgi:hypothetical protein